MYSIAMKSRGLTVEPKACLLVAASGECTTASSPMRPSPRTSPARQLFTFRRITTAPRHKCSIHAIEGATE